MLDRHRARNLSGPVNIMKISGKNTAASIDHWEFSGHLLYYYHHMLYYYHISYKKIEFSTLHFLTGGFFPWGNFPRRHFSGGILLGSAFFIGELSLGIFFHGDFSPGGFFLEGTDRISFIFL